VVKIQLGPEDLDYLRTRYSDGAPLSEVLPPRFWEADIHLIKGYDPSSGARFVAGADFNPDSARAQAVLMREKSEASPPHGIAELAREFTVLDTTVGGLDNMAVIDPATLEFLTEIERLFAYKFLADALFK